MLHVSKLEVDAPTPQVLPAVVVNGRTIRPKQVRRESERIYIIEARDPDPDSSNSEWQFEPRGMSKIKAPPRNAQDKEQERRLREGEDEGKLWVWVLLALGWGALFVALGRGALRG